ESLETIPAPQAAMPPPAKPPSASSETEATPHEAMKQPEVEAAKKNRAVGERVAKVLPNRVEMTLSKSDVEARLLAFLENRTAQSKEITWFDLDHVVFDSGRRSPRPGPQEQLRNIAKILAAYPQARVVIGGFTDDVGAAKANQKISQARAEFIRRELIGMGADGSRVEAKGYGEAHPIASNDTEDGRKKNRRVSLGVIAK
ncbi:OmpA family protein, partial [Methylocystis sp.]|uniref:OmpA family protein n=1 Tax=Methylocystis sp. TaxID=1911079 RepID=UPI003D0B0307